MLTLVLPYIKTAREVSFVWDNSLKLTELTSLMGLLFQTLKKFGGWKQLVVTIGLQDVFQTMPM